MSEPLSVFEQAAILGVKISDDGDLVALIEAIHRRESELMELRHLVERRLTGSPPARPPIITEKR